MSLKIISWNVNGIRAWMKKPEVWDFLDSENPDIFCIQESKCQEGQAESEAEKEKIAFFEKYKHHNWNFAEKKGYSGTAIFSKKNPMSVKNGIGDELDNEGRVITAEFENFFLVNVYTPNSKPDLSRADYRKDVWDKNFLKHLKKLEKKKPVVTCGDFNVAREQIDLKNPQANKTTEKNPGSPGFTDRERSSFENYFESFTDTFRFLHPEIIKYSWWSYRFNARGNNSGWRIDYFLISKILESKLKKAEIFDQDHGSDHCPVGVEISLK